MQGVFIGTFLIGLREGLEATLIVSIVAAFLKRNGRSVQPMFTGVALAVAISVGVGVGLDLLTTTLPQRQQEMMETVIGAIAVVFVTSMIIWMNRNAGRLKGDLEREAQEAISRGGSLALTAMAFLAVLKEGFETAVFLLAAAQTSHGSRWLAVLGGVAGIAAAIALGAGIYVGGLKLNLARFFRVTGAFLVLIAAGLVLGSLRTAHEAGWITIGQHQVFDLSPWLPGRSVRGALVTGLFGIPPDPRLVEVLGWLLYALPVLVVFLWPTKRALQPRALRRRLVATAAASIIGAAVLALAVPAGGAESVANARTAVDHLGRAIAVSLAAAPSGRALSIAPTAGAPSSVPLAAAGDESVDGVPVRVWQATLAGATDSEPTVTLTELAATTGGRLPVGLSAARTPGPFEAHRTTSTVYTIRVHGNSLVSAQSVSSRTAVLSGGGLTTPKTVSLGGLPSDWFTVNDQAIAAQLRENARQRAERELWRLWLPLIVAGFALVCDVAAIHAGRPTGPERGRAANVEARQSV
ncbi:iron uptake transporter permease EfeU [Mycobacterium vicinigordonae]|uniref:FTR1 family protein n=1 Tax=Mycobacterium vicinigordonae TaxID=1719132 RepID=A0A7D6DWN4_9MYCO|nr:iron uptake transporter permease EfeU [Mycobacterium vicinigordonae]QLL05650.1 FTR1 family protein [Mycobacterium vicinigordonae]